MSGSPGTLFTLSGTNFTPNSNAILHFRKPNNTESPNQTATIDANGNFSVSYSIPTDASLGTYQCWAINGSTGAVSNTVNYTIQQATSVLHHFDISQIGNQNVNVPFNVTIQAKDNYGNVVSYNGDLFLSLYGVSITPTKVNMQNGSIAFALNAQSPYQSTFLHCHSGSIAGDSNYFAINDSKPALGKLTGKVQTDQGNSIMSAIVELSKDNFQS